MPADPTSPPSPAERRIWIDTSFGRRRIRARIVARHFAVHRRWYASGKSQFFTVTHLPTGLACGKSYESQEVAITAARALAALPIRWANVRSGRELTKRLRARALRIIHRASFDRMEVYVR